MDLKEDSYVFLLQLFAILARSCSCPALEQIFHACITTQNHHETGLSQVMLLFANNYICSPGFHDAPFSQTDLNFQVVEQTAKPESQQILEMIYDLIQTPSIACYAYQTLNLLMRCDMTLDL